MHIVMSLVYNLETGKRVSRFCEVFDPQTGLTVESPLPKQILLPRLLPQEWLPAALRTGRSGPVVRWLDRSLFEEDESAGPEGLPG